MLDKILAFIAEKLEGMPGRMRPVGSIYLSIDPTDPSTLFGGTWERIQDRFLLAAGSTYRAGGTGGEATHTLTAAELPSHTHGSATLKGSFRVLQWTGGSASGVVTQGENKEDRTLSKGDSAGSRNFYVDATHEHSSVGSDQSHNNMPPYLAVYVWKRIA
ncbi:phage baseplate protein [Hornefia butyriciproducens]|uniref:phage baseplate protein n=1 Tax=Hornefia butyriciproducens TaxID=2652293 RepID=UPI003F88C168